jgi:hypothetical protein
MPYRIIYVHIYSQPCTSGALDVVCEILFSCLSHQIYDNASLYGETVSPDHCTVASYRLGHIRIQILQLYIRRWTQARSPSQVNFGVNWRPHLFLQVARDRSTFALDSSAIRPRWALCCRGLGKTVVEMLPWTAVSFYVCSGQSDLMCVLHVRVHFSWKAGLSRSLFLGWDAVYTKQFTKSADSAGTIPE